MLLFQVLEFSADLLYGIFVLCFQCGMLGSEIDILRVLNLCSDRDLGAAYIKVSLCNGLFSFALGVVDLYTSAEEDVMANFHPIFLG